MNNQLYVRIVRTTETMKDQEHKIFILVHPFSRATSSPLPTSKGFH